MNDDTILDPHRLRQFVTVARHLNITRAAEELHLTQQAVSSTLKTLERDLGVCLLSRTHNRIALTVEGTELLHGAQPILDATTTLIRRTRTAARPDHHHLTLGYTATITTDEVHFLTSSVRAHFPHARFTARQIAPSDIDVALREGRIDLALRRESPIAADTATKLLTSSPLNIALHHTHPLATAKAIELPHLVHHTLILWGDPDEPACTQDQLRLCRDAGFEPMISLHRFHGTSPTHTITTTNEFAFVTDEPGHYHHRTSVVVPISPTPTWPIHAQWTPHTVSLLRDALLADSQHLLQAVHARE
ncbi:LysR family transcriptional regulator [Rhodococcus erythropolis]|uniref:LysR family transcriptional regulator n=1 Tax=Rhodococcus erythropolis TaxID=1833 RepID=UPI00210A7863|nr:LysR family transcriptional regulator [Rhodococcus erythropolis]MCQ4129237.1 LysR family transcriptional regulator [Rhodococcus erythropolis]